MYCLRIKAVFPPLSADKTSLTFISQAVRSTGSRSIASRHSKKYKIPVDAKPYYTYNTVDNRIIRIIQFGRKVNAYIMISFESFVPAQGSPIYMQIVLHIKRGSAAGTIKDGDELPSRRMLSALLGVNPNTVQKAYRILEEEELISSHSGAKSVMILDENKKEKIRTELLENDIKNVIQSMQQMEISKEEALRLIDIYWR